jgi:hypothetical protein
MVVLRAGRGVEAGAEGGGREEGRRATCSDSECEMMTS